RRLGDRVERDAGEQHRARAGHADVVLDGQLLGPGRPPLRRPGERTGTRDLEPGRLAPADQPLAAAHPGQRALGRHPSEQVVRVVDRAGDDGARGRIRRGHGGRCHDPSSLTLGGLVPALCCVLARPRKLGRGDQRRSTGSVPAVGDRGEAEHTGGVRAGLDKQPAEVAAMFDRVARRYDLTNTVLSGGLDTGWRRATREALDPRPGQVVLDVAAGTAVSTVELAGTGATAIALDFSQGMLRAGASRPVPKVAGDAMRLPLADESVDGVVISFGLRNVADPDAALREFRRVTRPGGTLVVCEFSSPTWAPFRTVYTEYLMKALPRIARAVSSNPEAYVYLAESIRAWPDQSDLAGRIGDAGWADVSWRNLTGGIVALHRGRLPG